MKIQEICEMMNMKKALGISCGILGILLIGLGMVMKQKETAEISIIGGADGPTSVFIAGRLGGDFFNLLILIGVVLAAVVVILYLKKR